MIKKCFAILTVIILACGSVFAYEDYSKHKYNNLSNIAVGRFKNAYQSIERQLVFSNVSIADKSSVPYSYVIADLYKVKTFLHDGVEYKTIKLKEKCNPVPTSFHKINSSTACGKIIIDTDGFNNGSNKLFSDKKTVLPKDQFIIYLYSNAIKPAYMSPEDIILMSN